MVGYLSDPLKKNPWILNPWIMIHDQYDHYDSLGQPLYMMQEAGCNVKMDIHRNIST